MRTRFFGLLGACALAAATAAGCQAPPKNVTVSAIRVMVFDETGRAPSDIPRDLRSRIPNMAAEMGLIGQGVGDPGERIMIRGRIVEFPTHGQSSTASTWINAGPMTVEYTVSKEDGEELGTASFTTSPTDEIEVKECPFVWGQSRAVVRWLLGR